MGAALPELRGDLPPLPPELFAKARQRRPSTARTLVPIVVASLLITALPVVPEVISARHTVCAVPPASASGDPGQKTADELAAMLPAALTGYAATSANETGIGWFSYPATTVALVNAGFRAGFEREFVFGDVIVTMTVLQFDTVFGPSRYESRRLAELCAFPHRALATPTASGVSGTISEPRDALPTHRLSFIRGSRNYLITFVGKSVTSQLDVLRQVQATAR